MPVQWVRAVVVVLALAVPTAIQTMPAPWDIGERFATNPGDPVFLMWTMEHETRAVVDGDRDVLDGNIFHPVPNAIAWSDNVLAFTPVYAVASRLGGWSPIAGYNATVFIWYLVGALAVYVVAADLLRSRRAGFLAALLFTLAPYRSVGLFHPQLAGFAAVPVAVWCTVLLARGRWLAGGLGLGVAVAATWYTSSYYAVMAAIVIGALGAAIGIGAAIDRAWARLTTFAGGAALAMAFAGALVAPTFSAYYDLQDRFERTDAELIHADTADLLDVPPSLVWRWFGAAEDLTDTGALFPGGVCAVLVVSAGVLLVRSRRTEAEPGRTRRHAPRGSLVGMAVGGVLCAAVMIGPGSGVWSLGYDGLRAVVPGIASLRDLSRFWLYPQLLLSLAAGWAGAAMFRSAPTARDRWTLSIGLAALICVELLYRPDFATVKLDDRTTAAYQLLDYLEAGVVTELPAPMQSPRYPFIAVPRQLRSTIDGRPRIEGYSGNVPADLPGFEARAAAFPAPESIRYLRGRGVRWVVLHSGRRPCDGEYGPAELTAILTTVRRATGVGRVIPAGDDYVVELLPLPQGERAAALDADVPPPPDRPREHCARY